MHPRARTTPAIRLEIVDAVERGEPIAAVARRHGVSRPTVYKWVARFASGGVDELLDRRSIARWFPTRVARNVERQIERLRRSKRLLAWQIGVALEMARSTVIKVLKRLKLSRLKYIDPPAVYQRYEYAAPGQLVHIDIKKIARFARVGHRITKDPRRRSREVGYDTFFVAVDDCSRRSDVRLYDYEDGESAADFLRRTIAAYRRRGVLIERIMTDNGKVFTARVFRAVVAEFGIKHILTPPFTPRWNGKAERFIQTMLREWAYAITYRNSYERNLTLAAWLRYYNQDRQHGALNYAVPAARWVERRKQPA